MALAYAAAALLVLAHEADRLSTWLEDLGRKGESRPFAWILDLGADLKDLTVASGLSGLKAGEARIIEALTPRSVVGARTGSPRPVRLPGSAPSPVPSPGAAPGAAPGLAASSPLLRPAVGPGADSAGLAFPDGAPGRDSAPPGLAAAVGPPGSPGYPAGTEPTALAVGPGGPRAPSPRPAPAGEATYAPGEQDRQVQVYSAAARRPDYRDILIVGDSFMVEGFGPVLERELRKIPELEVKRVFKSATGLCRPDFFDWFSFMEGLLEENAPELVVISLGANDTQDIVTEDRTRHMVATEGWNEVYAERVKRILDMAGDSGATVFWVGLPIMGKKLYNQRVNNLNSVVAGACADALNCRYFDTWDIMADPDGEFTAFRTMPDGKHERIRAKDSIHLTELGGEILVEAFLQIAGGWGIYGIPDAGSAAADGEDTLPVGAEGERPSAGAADASGTAQSGPAAAGAGPMAVATGTAPAAASASGGAAPRAQGAALAALRAPRPAGSYPAEAVSPAALIEVNLPSRARLKETSYLLCLPGPEDVARPTVILLHGPDESYRVWRERYGHELVDLARDNGVNLVMPDGDPHGWYLDSPFKRESRLESYIMRELIPDAAGRFLMDPERVGLLGVSMGGHGALTLALKHPGRFRFAGSISGITVLESHIGDPAGGPPLRVESVLGPYRSQGKLWRDHSAYHLARRDPGSLAGTALALSVGVADPVALAENRQFHRLLNDLSVPHSYGEEQGGLHGWEFWSGEVPLRLAEAAGRL
jgi:S-formylglutathione hydrolase FrmB